jgi:hypothetical protein
MAKKLETFPEVLVERPTQYPWKEWLDGDVWELQRGPDYKVTSDSLRTQARVRANKMGGSIRASIINNGKGLILQYVAPSNGHPDGKE